jgi:hypothetical protein
MKCLSFTYTKVTSLLVVAASLAAIGSFIVDCQDQPQLNFCNIFIHRETSTRRLFKPVEKDLKDYNKFNNFQ